MANESDYLGPVQYARLFGMLTGRERQGERFVAMVESGVDQVKRAVAALPRRSVLSAWWMNGDTWMVTVRGAANRLLEDAGGINVMRRPDDPRLDDTMQMPSETVLTDGGKADCWLWRDPISKRFGDQRFLAHMRAWRDGCVFAADGGEKPGWMRSTCSSGVRFDLTCCSAITRGCCTPNCAAGPQRGCARISGQGAARGSVMDRSVAGAGALFVAILVLAAASLCYGQVILSPLDVVGAMTGSGIPPCPRSSGRSACPASSPRSSRAARWGSRVR